jgi:hypothetical protein
MAPEISTGNYTRSIDVYASGVMLHEMLTGKLPFDGESDGEILMKHLTATPKLDGVPAAFKPVIEKALEKNPLKRYATMTEMARAVEAAYPTQGGPVAPPTAKPAVELQADPPASPPAPPAAVVARPIPVATAVSDGDKRPAEPPVIKKAAANAVAVPPSGGGGTFRDRLMDLTGAMAKAPLVAACGVIPWALVTGTIGDWPAVGKLFLVTTALAWAVLAAAHGARVRAEDSWGRRLRLATLGLGVGLLTFWLDGWVGPEIDPPIDENSTAETYLFGTVKLPPHAGPVLIKYGLYFACVLGACRWWRMAARDRKERFSLFGPIAAAFWGAVLLFLWPWDGGASPAAGIVPLVLAAVAVQWVSPWAPPPPPAPRRLRWKAA